jgi:hypothetical protein
MLLRRSVALERHFGVTPERLELLAFIDFPFDDRIGIDFSSSSIGSNQGRQALGLLKSRASIKPTISDL